MIFEIFGFADTSGYFNNLVRQGPFVNHDDIGTQQHKTVQGGLSHHCKRAAANVFGLSVAVHFRSLS